jgi:hypothetical protein
MEIGAVGVIALTLAITQAVKMIFGVEGKWNRLVALVIGSALAGLSYSIENGLIVESAFPYIEMIVLSIAYGLSAIGLFDFTKEELPNILVSAVDKLRE